MDRPMVNVPEGPNEKNVYRPMNDEEFAQLQADIAEQKRAESDASHPLIAQIESMSEDDKKALRAALEA